MLSFLSITFGFSNVVPRQSLAIIFLRYIPWNMHTVVLCNVVAILFVLQKFIWSLYTYLHVKTKYYGQVPLLIFPWTELLNVSNDKVPCNILNVNCIFVEFMLTWYCICIFECWIHFVWFWVNENWLVSVTISHTSVLLGYGGGGGGGGGVDLITLLALKKFIIL